MKLSDSHGRKKQTNNRTAPTIAMIFDIFTTTSLWHYFDIFQIAALSKKRFRQSSYAPS